MNQDTIPTMFFKLLNVYHGIIFNDLSHNR